MWSYYGAKTNIVHLYPPPKYGRIIEPFAGTARYALRYWDREVILVDKYEVIVKIWNWLQQCSPADILNLPRFLKPGDSLDNFSFDCEEAKMLMGFIIVKGVERPRKKATEWATKYRPSYINFKIKKIASNLHKIKHWKIRCGDYSELENTESTWFIDPPYQHGGHSYIKNNKSIDFNSLSIWCKGRAGQVIVCENEKADWLDFKPFISHQGRTGKQKEFVWLNNDSNYNSTQLLLL